MPSVHLKRLDVPRGRPRLLGLVEAELRLALQGCRWWWYAVAVGLVAAQLFAPLDVSHGPLLVFAWIWPILIWSPLGSRESRHGTQQLLFSSARFVPRQLPACWLAGVTVMALAGAGTAVRLLMGGRLGGLAGWLAGALFVPALALALGVWSGSSRFFEALYTALWYVGPLNRVPGIDFTGATPAPHPGRTAAAYLIFTAALLAIAFVGRLRQARGI